MAAIHGKLLKFMVRKFRKIYGDLVAIFSFSTVIRTRHLCGAMADAIAIAPQRLEIEMSKKIIHKIKEKVEK